MNAPRVLRSHEASRHAFHQRSHAEVGGDGRILGGRGLSALLAVDKELAVLVTGDANRAVEVGGLELWARVGVLRHRRLERAPEVAGLEAEACVEGLTEERDVGALDLDRVHQQSPRIAEVGLDRRRRDDRAADGERHAARVSKEGERVREERDGSGRDLELTHHRAAPDDLPHLSDGGDGESRAVHVAEPVVLCGLGAVLADRPAGHEERARAEELRVGKDELPRPFAERRERRLWRRVERLELGDERTRGLQIALRRSLAAARAGGKSEQVSDECSPALLVSRITHRCRPGLLDVCDCRSVRIDDRRLV
mmetsp:Transcript_19132/g.63243  ORF Transcript_19132/g.63243 Transcript_19132/m.63243 type:complete len:311 (-) Transcript_19132:157-1089(-)